MGDTEKLLEAFITSFPSLLSAAKPWIPGKKDAPNSHPQHPHATEGCAGADLVGEWSGVIHQRNGATRQSHVSVCTFREEKCRILGVWTLEAEVRSQPATMYLRTVGDLWDHHYLSCNYIGWLQGTDPGRTGSFGHFLLHLSLDRLTLTGYFHGVGIKAEKLVYGKVLLERK